MRKENLRAYLAWLNTCIFWGTTYLAIRIGVSKLPPMLFAGTRWLIAGIILFIFLKYKSYKLPRLKDLKDITIVGILLLGFGNGLVVLGEKWVPSGLTALLITTVPLWIVGIEALLPEGYRMNMKIISGLLMGLAGVCIIFGRDFMTYFDKSFLTGIIVLSVAVFIWACGTLYSKYKKVDVHPLMNSSVQMIIAGILQLLLGVILGELPEFRFELNSSLALLYLILFGSLVGYTSYIYAIAHLPVSFVSTYAYINPVIALFLGWLILGEKLDLTIIISAIIIFAGVALVKSGTGKISSHKNISELELKKPSE